MYPAHIRETGERQTVREHCRNTAALAANALRPLGLEKSAYLAGLLHDAGKNKQEYAQYLSEAVSGGNAVRGSVNHTFAGVRLLLDRWHGRCDAFSYSDVTAELLAFAVGSHHGLFDCIDPQQHSGFFHRQTKEGIFYDESRQGFLAEVADEEELERLFHSAVREMTPMLDRLAALSTQVDDNEADRETAFYIGLLARMLLSAVIEGDRTDTAAFMDDLKPPSFPEDMRPIWAGRLAFMEKRLTIINKSTKRIGTVGINPSDFPFNFYLFICCPDDRYQCVHHLPLVLKADILPVIQIPGNAFHLLHRHSVRREFCNLIGNGLPPCVQLLNFAVGIGEQNRACARQRVKQLFNLAFHLRQFQPLCRQLRGDFRRIFPACQRLKIF